MANDPIYLTNTGGPDGLTLRDLFAAAALVGLLAARYADHDDPLIVSRAYSFADALLTERTREPAP
jgi:hypothetical protein